MALRIFEARYIRMVKEACAANSCFCICMYNNRGDVGSNQHIYNVGTMVRIVDFDMLKDGLLGITVEGESLVGIDDIETEKDGLRTGIVKPVEHMYFNVAETEQGSKLASRLRQIINNYPEIAALYPEPQYDDNNWVVFRWLELLPIKAEQKQALLQEPDPNAVGAFLEELIK